ncbi:MAG: type II secretion system protein [Rubritalea sp.]|uniref:type II secretion system protein n=1 Tax=Rubritalea sp. TaxID=2109375 RepID=UPI003241ED5E
MKNCFKSQSPQARSAFTLIEMLVVLVIMSTLIGIGAQVMKNATTAQGTDTAASMAESLFAEARGLAKSSGSSTRVVIYAGGGTGDDRTKHLRYMGIVGQDKDATTGEYLEVGEEPLFKDQLKARGVKLPSKVFFNANLSNVSATMPVQIPGMTGTQQCYYYEFNAEGVITEPAAVALDDPVSFVVQSGQLYPTDDTPRVAKAGSRDVAGFAIWKRGNTTLFRSPEQVPSLPSGSDPTF